MKKDKFKTLVKKACQKLAFENLSNIKETKTKLDNCEYKDLKLQKYLNNEHLISRKQKLLFRVEALALANSCQAELDCFITWKSAPPIPQRVGHDIDLLGT